MQAHGSMVLTQAQLFLEGAAVLTTLVKDRTMSPSCFVRPFRLGLIPTLKMAPLSMRRYVF